MAKIESVYFSDPTIRKARPLVTRALETKNSSLSRKRSDYAYGIRQKDGSPIREAFVEADSLIYASGDDPQKAEEALERALGELRGGIDRESSSLTAEDQTDDEDVVPQDSAVDLKRLMESIQMSNEKIFAAYEGIFGTMP